MAFSSAGFRAGRAKVPFAKSPTSILGIKSVQSNTTRTKLKHSVFDAGAIPIDLSSPITPAPQHVQAESVQKGLGTLQSLSNKENSPPRTPSPAKSTAMTKYRQLVDGASPSQKHRDAVSEAFQLSDVRYASNEEADLAQMPKVLAVGRVSLKWAETKIKEAVLTAPELLTLARFHQSLRDLHIYENRADLSDDLIRLLSEYKTCVEFYFCCVYDILASEYQTNRLMRLVFSKCRSLRKLWEGTDARVIAAGAPSLATLGNGFPAPSGQVRSYLGGDELDPRAIRGGILATGKLSPKPDNQKNGSRPGGPRDKPSEDIIPPRSPSPTAPDTVVPCIKRPVKDVMDSDRKLRPRSSLAIDYFALNIGRASVSMAKRARKGDGMAASEQTLPPISREVHKAPQDSAQSVTAASQMFEAPTSKKASSTLNGTGKAMPDKSFESASNNHAAVTVKSSNFGQDLSLGGRSVVTLKESNDAIPRKKSQQVTVKTVGSYAKERLDCLNERTVDPLPHAPGSTAFNSRRTSNKSATKPQSQTASRSTSEDKVLNPTQASSHSKKNLHEPLKTGTATITNKENRQTKTAPSVALRDSKTATKTSAIPVVSKKRSAAPTAQDTTETVPKKLHPDSDPAFDGDVFVHQLAADLFPSFIKLGKAFADPDNHGLDVISLDFAKLIFKAFGQYNNTVTSTSASGKNSKSKGSARLIGPGSAVVKTTYR